METVTKKTYRPSPDAMLNPRRDANFKTLFTDNSDEARLALKSFYDKTSKAPFSAYKMQTDDNRRLSDRLNIIFIELPKINDVPDNIKRLTLNEKWAKFLLYADRKDKINFVRELCESEEGIMAAQVTLAKISEDEANWLRETARDMWERDQISKFGAAERRGAKKVARNMLAKGLSIEMIAECTELSLEEITALQAELTATA